MAQSKLTTTDPQAFDYQAPYSSTLQQRSDEFQKKQFGQMTHELSFGTSLQLSYEKLYQRMMIDNQSALRSVKEKLGIGSQGEDQQMIAPQKLNEMFPGLSSPFTEEMPMDKAAFIAMAQQKRKYDDQILSMAKPGAVFLGGLGASFSDPVNWAATIATGGLFRAVGMTAESAIAARSAYQAAQATKTAVKAGLASRVAFGVAEGVVGGVLTEPLLRMGAEYQQMPKSWGQSLQDIGIQGAMGGIFEGGIYGLGQFWNSAKRGRTVSKNGIPMSEPELPATVNSMVNGRKPLVTAIQQERLAQLSGEVSPNYAKALMNQADPTMLKDVKYSYTPYKSLDPMDKRKFFVALDNNGKPLPISDDMGRTVSINATDNPFVANGNASAQTGRGGSVRVIDLDHTNLKLLDLNEPLPKEVADSILPYYAALVGDKKAIDNVMDKSGRQVLTDLQYAELVNPELSRQSIMDNIVNPKLKELGYDGLLHSGQGLHDNGKAHNVLNLFEGKKIKSFEDVDPDHDSVYKMDDAEVANTIADKNTPTFQNESNDPHFIQSLKESLDVPPDTAKLQTIVNERVPELNEHIKQIELSGDLKTATAAKQELEFLKLTILKQKQDDLTMQALRVCIDRNG